MNENEKNISLVKFENAYDAKMDAWVLKIKTKFHFKIVKVAILFENNGQANRFNYPFFHIVCLQRFAVAAFILKTTHNQQKPTLSTLLLIYINLKKKKTNTLNGFTDSNLWETKMRWIFLSRTLKYRPKNWRKIKLEITFNANQMVTVEKKITSNYFARINANRFLSVSHAHYQSVALRYKVR